jgi:ATP-dependent DNA helicase RecG
MAEIDPKTLKESETVERKESLNDKALKTLSAFANTKGGSLYVGIKDDATLIGGGISDQAQQDIVNKVVNNLGLIPEVSLHTFQDQEFLEVKVKKSDRPISYNGKYYKRAGNTTRELDSDGLKSLFLKGVSWDNQLDDRFSIEEIDDVVLSEVAVKSRGKRGIPEWEEIGDEEFLQHLNLMADGKLTHAAILLFGEDPQKYFPHATIRIGRFKDKSTIIADHSISGNLFQQLEKAEQVIKSLINKRYDITGESFARKEVWDYPLSAIREALLNAMVHRDYLITSSEIEIKIFDDHIWFYNPGKLPEGLTVDQLEQPHSSIRRNRLIADVFFRAGFIEQFGSGTLRMIEALTNAGHPKPKFKEQANGFVVVFDEVKESFLDKYQELNDRQLMAMELAEEGPIQTSDLHDKFPDYNRKTITRDLQELVDKNIFRQEGKGKGTRYILDL